MDQLLQFATLMIDRLVEVLLFPVSPDSRIYWLYLVSSGAVAWLVYRAIRRQAEHATAQDAEAAGGSFVQFLFPRAVWSHPSAWLDIRYMLFHKTLSFALVGTLGAVALAFGFNLASGGLSIAETGADNGFPTGRDLAIGSALMLGLLLVSDLIGWILHYLQHKVPLLWQFHKVHHSAEVMHPISNFREHPVDNITYSLFIGFGYGAAYGLAVGNLGFAPSMPTLFGIPALMFAFNIAGYNLRHSHVWLRWPGIWSAVFPSPAHHHVHHSCHPDHLDKNFAFMFPFWDVIFGTYHMPKDNRDVKFGIIGDASELNSCTRLYWVPFRDAFRLFVPRKPQKEMAEAGRDDAQVTAE